MSIQIEYLKIMHIQGFLNVLGQPPLRAGAEMVKKGVEKRVKARECFTRKGVDDLSEK